GDREEGDREHVQAAVSRGIPARYVIRRHILRNAAIPITTISGITISYILISHDLAVVRQLTHETIVLHRGTVVERGPTAHVLDNPEHPAPSGFAPACPGPAGSRDDTCCRATFIHPDGTAQVGRDPFGAVEPRGFLGSDRLAHMHVRSPGAIA